MKKKVLVLAAFAALTVGVFTTTTQNNSLTINKAQAGPEVVACYWRTYYICVIDGQWWIHFHPIMVDLPSLPTH
ncbi:MAG: hypothetical protein RBR40_13760 [Tenuifilaceae bacterium]|nr:hypothetical protein [Tenuifilaceae bacterium]